MSSDKTGGKGTRKGRPNYKNSILLKVIRSILPASKLEWEEVADDYKLSTKEEDLRGYEDVKCHFIKKVCNSNKNVTGSSAPHAVVLAAQKVYQEILEKEGSGDYGAYCQRDDVFTHSCDQQQQAFLLRCAEGSRYDMITEDGGHERADELMLITRAAIDCSICTPAA